MASTISLKTLLTKILEKLKYQDRIRKRLYTTHSITSSATGAYNSPTLLTLEPHTRYLLMGQGQCSTGSAVQLYSKFIITSNASSYNGYADPGVQPYATAGATHTFMGYIETGDLPIGIGITTYKYSTGYTLTWQIYAIEL